ncbi:MAG: hypothetical protein ABIJ92_01960 [Candidatus Aenigmatarchaeota archaeon]
MKLNRSLKKENEGFAIPQPPMPTEQPPTPPTGTPRDSPPLFIKIDRYKDVVKEIQRLKSYSLGLRDALDALVDIENELKNGLSLAQKALDHFSSVVSLLDAKFLRIQGVESNDLDDVPDELDNHIKGLYNQMEKIKSDMRTFDDE